MATPVILFLLLQATLGIPLSENYTSQDEVHVDVLEDVEGNSTTPAIKKIQPRHSWVKDFWDIVLLSLAVMLLLVMLSLVQAVCAENFPELCPQRQAVENIALRDF